ncbi:TonB-dependent siderophore receptor, partial [uncultured Phenylobacterium sp.]|uniref:TonB-dependent receptor plug domain-containing protein n=1 Tax=uncultured Phenylobacterium sp. TaxID=349273 RepID=UPI0025FFCF58
MRRSLLCSTTCAAVGLLLAAGGAAAQTTGAAAADPASELDEITVTGTRVQRDGYDAPTPTTVLGAETLERKAVNNVIDVLATLPVMKSSAGPQTGSASVAGNGGQSFVNLRGLGAVRTLVLVNGERIVPTTNLATVDVALLPTGALQRIDVVTGGASAAWGSDAVAGVVNFVIDTEFQGLKGDVQAGVTTRGDGKSGKVSLTMGDRFLGDRLHLMASGEYYQTDGVEPDSRPWSQYPSMDIFTNTASATNGLAPRLLRPFVYQTIVNGGTITGGPLAGISFGDNGTTYQTPFCALRTATSQVCDSDQENLFNNATQFAYMQSPQHRAALMLRGSYKLSDTWSVFAQGLYGESSSTVNSAALSTSVAGTLTIQRDNAFLPESIRQRMVALNLATFPLGTVALNRGGTVATRANTMYVGTVGVEGTVGGWNVRGYYEYGRARNHTTAANNYSRAPLTEAFDAVRDANGATVNVTVEPQVD